MLEKSSDPASDRAAIYAAALQAFRFDIPIPIFCFLIYFVSSFYTAAKSASTSEAIWIDLDININHWIWWAATFPRILIRGRRLYDACTAASDELSRSIHVEEAKKIAMTTVLSAHWIGCVFFFMSRLRQLDRRTWVSSIEDTLVVYSRFESPLHEQYILALWKGFSSISSIEFTGYLANNAEEQIAGILMLIVQMYISSVILGTIIHYLALKGASQPSATCTNGEVAHKCS